MVWVDPDPLALGGKWLRISRAIKKKPLIVKWLIHLSVRSDVHLCPPLTLRRACRPSLCDTQRWMVLTLCPIRVGIVRSYKPISWSSRILSCFLVVIVIPTTRPPGVIFRNVRSSLQSRCHAYQTTSARNFEHLATVARKYGIRDPSFQCNSELSLYQLCKFDGPVANNSVQKGRRKRENRTEQLSRCCLTE
ncbi:hypothetical protein TNCV_2382891 [Trichonephila clavipes]|nr:hypothetical protein TNCV_2382891 [Trichonephila clavipes]